MTGRLDLRRAATFAGSTLALTLGLALSLVSAAGAEPLAPCGDGDGDEIEFCRLAPEDFRAKTPPEEFRHRVDGLDAVACIRLRWPALEPIYTERPGRLTKVEYHDVRFFAAFDRDCSFWGEPPEDPELAIEHQQIHFAIAEYAARERMRDRPLGKVRGYGKTREQALENLEIRMGRIAESGVEDAQRQHAAFDALVRARPTAETQQRWRERYQELLGVEF